MSYIKLTSDTMFKRRLYEYENLKIYRRGFLDGITFTTEFLKHVDYEETMAFLNNTLENLDYYAKKYAMNKRDLKKNTEVLLRNLQYFYHE